MDCPGTYGTNWPDKGLLPRTLQLGHWEELSTAQQAGRQAVSTAEQAVSCDYLLCFGAELSGSRWGYGTRGGPTLRRPWEGTQSRHPQPHL